jgi:serine palmitoyltransferase
MADLRKILESIKADDRTLGRDSTQQRRFIVVEGVYQNTGNVCNLKELIALKEEFFYRIFMDETISFATLGRTGRGITEHFDVEVSNIDVLNISLETSLGSVGGVCVGTREVVRPVVNYLIW